MTVDAATDEGSEAPPPDESDLRWSVALLHPHRWLLALTGGGSVYALLILFGLNAVDELDRTAFGILLPEIRDDFGLSLQGILTLVAIVFAAALALQVPIAQYADTHRRVPVALGGAALWGVFSLATGFVGTVLALGIVRSGSAIGKAVVDPTHNSLIADYYAPDARSRVYSFHRAANAVGQFVGPLSAGLLAAMFSWRVPFIVFAVPTAVLVIAGLRMREPVRGAQERRAMGVDEAAIDVEEEPASFSEGWRTVWKIQSLRRIWMAMPFLAAALIGFVSLASLLYEEEFGLSEVARGTVAASVEPAQLVGLIIGARIATRYIVTDPGRILRLLAWISVGVSFLAAGFALAPNIAFAVAMNLLITAALAIVAPGILAALAMAIPARTRSLGFSIASLWVLPGLVVLPIIGALGDAFGIRVGMLVLTPVFLIGGLILSSAGTLIGGDVKQVWAATAARSEARYERLRGNDKILLVRGVDVSYDDVQVLFGVDLEVRDGEILALLGTNGAGKSTVLRAVSGLTEADRGAVIFDGIDITHAPPEEIARRGVVQVPGGAGVFPQLTVAENLRLAAWRDRHDHVAASAGVAAALARFPVLERRVDDAAADLSGGQQQMLALAMAFVVKPRLLMIDELSLGLAPVVVAELLPQIEQLRDQGTTVLLVEQSVNIALAVADRAVFMEKGEVRFEGPAAELADRRDLLRSVYLAGALEDGPETPPGAASNGDGEAAALELQAMAAAFGGVRAVDDVALRVAPGEIVGLIGPNGAGKTTLFDLISGFVPGGTGRVVLDGVDISAESAPRRAAAGLGRSFQDARLFPSLTVEEAIAAAMERFVAVRDPVTPALHLPANFDSEAEVAARTDELIDVFGLEAFRTKFVRELSTGSRRIVDLACVAAHRPTVVLLDEPSSGIAQREAEALGPLLRRLRDGLGASLVVIDHDLTLLASVADRLIAMDQGRVIAEGPPRDVLAAPEVITAYLGPPDSRQHRSNATTDHNPDPASKA